MTTSEVLCEEYYKAKTWNPPLGFESVYDKEPESEHDIIYWARAVLEQQLRNGELNIDRCRALLKQLRDN